MFDSSESQPLERVPRHEWISRIASAAVATTYLGVCIAIGSYHAFVGLIPYLGLALLCTCFPRLVGLGYKPTVERRGVVFPWWSRWRWTPPALVMLGGWVLLMLPAVVGIVLLLRGKK